MKVAHAGCGREIIYARDRAEVAPAGNGWEDTRARGVDEWRRVRGERGDVRAGGLESPGRSEDCALGSVVERRQCAAGPKERHGQAFVSSFAFV